MSSFLYIEKVEPNTHRMQLGSALGHKKDVLVFLMYTSCFPAALMTAYVMCRQPSHVQKSSSLSANHGRLKHAETRFYQSTPRYA